MAKSNLTHAEISQLLDAYQSEIRKLEFQKEAITEAILKLQKHSVAAEVVIEKTVEVEKPAPKKPGPKPRAEKAAQNQADTKVAVVSKGTQKGKKPKTEEVPVPAVEPVTEPAPLKKPKGSKAKADKPAALAEPTEKKKPGRPRLDSKVGVENPAKTTKKEKSDKPAKPPKATKGPQEEGKKKPGPKPTYNKWDMIILNTLKEKGQPMTSADLIEKFKDERDASNDSLGDTALGQLLNRSLNKLGNKQDLLNKNPYMGKGHAYSLKNPNMELPA